MTILAFSQFRYQGAVAGMRRPVKEVQHRKLDWLEAPSGGPGAFCYGVVALANGMTIACARRLASARARLPQNGHRVVQRLPST